MGQRDFGYRTVEPGEKPRLVERVFTSVADSYDFMNDAMSLGVHRLWKRHFVATSGAKPGDAVLDLAGGTGDIAALLAERVGDRGAVVLSDVNAAMLARGRDRMLDRGIVRPMTFALVDAERIPFAPGTFDLATIAFGLRNVADQEAALVEILRVLKPGGKLAIMEFSRVREEKLGALYDWYSFNVIPRLGKWLAGDEESYRYLVESIRKHPDQETLLRMLQEAGFVNCAFRNLSAGAVAIHIGYKI